MSPVGRIYCCTHDMAALVGIDMVGVLEALEDSEENGDEEEEEEDIVILLEKSALVHFTVRTGVSTSRVEG